MPDIQTTISELQHQISIDTLVITDLRNKVEKWHGLAKDIVTVLGNNTDMFHECMDSWIDLMVDTDERGTMKALAQNIVDRMHEIKHSEWNDPFSCMDKRTPAPDDYIPRPTRQHVLKRQETPEPKGILPMTTQNNILVITPKHTPDNKKISPWLIRMDRISAYHPSVDTESGERSIELLVDGHLLHFNESTHEAILSDSETHRCAVVPWEQVHTAIQGQFADEWFYTEIAVRDALKNNP